jgi:hypothetical protein
MGRQTGMLAADSTETDVNGDSRKNPAYVKWSDYGLSLNRFKSSVQAANFDLLREIVWPLAVGRSYDTGNTGAALSNGRPWSERQPGRSLA